MCEASSIAMVVIAALGAGMSAYSQEQQYQMNKQAAKDNYAAQMAALAAQKQQIDRAATDEQSVIARAEQARMAQLRVAAGESGVSGLSVDRAEGEIWQDQAFDITAVESNRAFAAQQNSVSAMAAAAQRSGSINAVSRANWGATALQIAGTALSAYNSSTQANKQKAGVQLQ